MKNALMMFWQRHVIILWLIEQKLPNLATPLKAHANIASSAEFLC